MLAIEWDDVLVELHPPLRDKLSGDELEVVRGYVAEEIRARLGADLLARASAGLLEPADDCPTRSRKQ